VRILHNLFISSEFKVPEQFKSKAQNKSANKITNKKLIFIKSKNKKNNNNNNK